MILTTIFNLFGNMWIGLFEMLPTLPNFPVQFTNAIDQFINIIFQFGELIMFFLPPWWLLEILIYFSIVLEIFVIAYYVLMWILGKIPIIDIH